MVKKLRKQNLNWYNFNFFYKIKHHKTKKEINRLIKRGIGKEKKA
jgi:hypothetical protein